MVTKKKSSWKYVCVISQTLSLAKADWYQLVLKGVSKVTWTYIQTFMYAIYQLLQIGLSKFVGLPPVIIGVDTQILMIQFEISEICRTFRKLSFFATHFSS